MVPLAWSPLAGGLLAHAVDASAPLPSNPVAAATAKRLQPILADIAKAYGTTPLAILFAWLMRHPSGIIPILGSVRRQAMIEAASADAIELDRVNWYRLLVAARGEHLP